MFDSQLNANSPALIFVLSVDSSTGSPIGSRMHAAKATVTVATSNVSPNCLIPVFPPTCHSGLIFLFGQLPARLSPCFTGPGPS